MENMENQVVVQHSATEFTVGSVLSRTMSTLFKKPVLFIGLTLMASVPATIIIALLVALVLGSGNSASMMVGIIVVALLGFIINWIFTLVLQGAISYGVFRELRSENTGFGNALGRGFASIGTLLPLAVVAGICIGVGYILFFIPGIIISCILAVVVPVCVVEKRGVFECMGRSAELTKGNRLKIFAVFFLVGVVVIIINKFIIPAIAVAIPNSIVIMIVTIVLLVIPQAFQGVMTAVIYFDLRAVKEGVSVDALAEVFE